MRQDVVIREYFTPGFKLASGNYYPAQGGVVIESSSSPEPEPEDGETIKTFTLEEWIEYASNPEETITGISCNVPSDISKRFHDHYGEKNWAENSPKLSYLLGEPLAPVKNK